MSGVFEGRWETNEEADFGERQFFRPLEGARRLGLLCGFEPRNIPDLGQIWRKISLKSLQVEASKPR